MANTKITSHVIADNAVTTAMVTDANITHAKLHGTMDLSGKTVTLPAIAIPSASTGTTQSASDNTTKIATTAYVTTAISNLNDSAPAALNTLNEIAAALGDDANYASTTTAAIAAKLPLAGGTMSGAIAMGTAKITGLGNPTANQDAGTKTYIDTADALKLNLSGGTLTGDLILNTTTSLKIPVGTTGQRPSAATGLIRFNSTDGALELYNGSAWTAVGTGSSSKILDTFTGNGSATAYTLSVTPANEDALMVFIDGVYQEKGDYALSNAVLTLDTAPASGEKLAVHITTASVHDGTSAVNQQFTGNGSATAYTLSQDPLSENNTHIYINGVYQQKTDYTVSGTTLTFDTAPVSGDIIEVNMFTVATLGNTDTMSEGSGNLYHTTARARSAISASGIVSYNSSSGVITAAVANDSIDSQHYVDGSIDVGHMSANSIDSAQYVDGSIDVIHMSANSVDSDQYVDGSIDLIHMSANSVDSDQYVDGSIDTAHIANGAIGADQLSSSATAVIETNIALLGFYRASDNSKAKYSLVDQVIDEYQDASGIDASASTDEVLGGSGGLKYYSGLTNAAGSTITTTYAYDGTDDTITLNNGESIAGTIMAWGGAGGADSSGSGRHGGAGGHIRGTFAYSSNGTNLIVSVGQGGMMGTKGGSGGAGGGYSGLFLGSKTHGNTMLIAAGAGGAGDGQHGAYGGGTTGGVNYGGGGGGTQSAGGALGSGSSGYSQPVAGSALQGGNAGSEQDPAPHSQVASFNGGGVGGAEPGGKMAGGGGGGGYYGGAGGHAHTSGYAGGGGSSYHNSTYLSSVTNVNGGANAPGYTGTNYPSGVGASALSQAGGNGALWISYAITAPTGANMVLQSTDTAATTAPTSGDLVILIEDATGTATLNTDIKGYVSRDSGANFTQGTLVSEGSWGTNKKILAIHDADISGQPSGTAMCYKITMHNQSASKITRVHATSFAWA